MTSSKSDIAVIITAMAELYRTTINDTQMMAYTESLQRWPIEAIQQAASLWVENNPRFPMLSQFHDAVRSHIKPVVKIGYNPNASDFEYGRHCMEFQREAFTRPGWQQWTQWDWEHELRTYLEAKGISYVAP